MTSCDVIRTLLLVLMIESTIGGGKVYVSYLSHRALTTSDGQDQCCSRARADTPCTSSCTTVFQIALSSQDFIGKHQLLGASMSDEDMKEQVPFLLEKPTNPVVFQLDQWQEEFAIAVKVLTIDSLTEQITDDIDQRLTDDISINIQAPYPSPFWYHSVNITSARIELQFGVRYECDPEFVGMDCTIDCLMLPWLPECYGWQQQLEQFDPVETQTFHYFGSPIARCSRECQNTTSATSTPTSITQSTTSYESSEVTTTKSTARTASSVITSTESITGASFSCSDGHYPSTDESHPVTKVHHSSPTDISSTSIYPAKSSMYFHASTILTSSQQVSDATQTQPLSVTLTLSKSSLQYSSLLSQSLDLSSSETVSSTTDIASSNLNSRISPSSANLVSPTDLITSSSVLSVMTDTPVEPALTQSVHFTSTEMMDTSSIASTLELPTPHIFSTSMGSGTTVPLLSEMSLATPTLFSSTPTLAGSTETSLQTTTIVSQIEITTTVKMTATSQDFYPTSTLDASISPQITITPTSTTSPTDTSTRTLPTKFSLVDPATTTLSKAGGDPPITTTLPETSDSEDSTEIWVIVVGALLGGIVVVLLLGYIIYRTRRTSVQKRQEIYTVTPQMISAIEENGTAGRSDVPMTTSLL